MFYLFFNLVVEALHESVGLKALALDGLLLGADPLERRLAGVAAAVVGAAALARAAAVAVGEAALLARRPHLGRLKKETWVQIPTFSIS